MKLKNIAIVTLINLFMAVAAFADAPSNDNFANALVLESGIQVHITRSNIAATKETGEPNHANNAGGCSVWFKWTAQITRRMQISTNREPTGFDTLIHVYTGTTLGGLFSTASNNNIDSTTNLRSRANFTAVAGTTYYIAVDGFSENGGPAATGSFRLDMQPYFIHQGADFDSDGMTDLSVFRPSTGEWIVDGTTRSFTQQWGTNGDIPVIATQSPKPGLTVFRPSNGVWYHRPECCNDVYLPFGATGDIPVPESYNGDVSYFATFRPSNGVWHIYSTSDVSYYQFGQQGDIPVPGQYSADRFADIAVFRPSEGNWYFKIRSGTLQADDTFRAIHFGQAGDKPAPADYDGDGMLDVAVYRPSTGTWWIFQSGLQQVVARQWGIAEDIPTPGDFDGDGHADIAVFRPSTATWFILRSSDSQLQAKQFGQSGDIPMTSNRGY